ncbi:hypothetical protein CC80DRAFT_121593 [Byssothecium circinans]|uniref:Uncharacterized protein n=1 Tax=Byssothecium circinans TaxID=147558 RepID=A0A6A5TS89_9PLEO|nr:hypothetical protein CC80DRAFT_121593 [Byssothecium circinans]
MPTSSIPELKAAGLARSSSHTFLKRYLTSPPHRLTWTFSRLFTLLVGASRAEVVRIRSVEVKRSTQRTACCYHSQYSPWAL